MKIAVAGLGLIGGSIAKGFSLLDETKVLGYDKDSNTVIMAKLEKAIDESLTDKNIKDCDYIFIALYPKATVEFLKKYADKIKKDAVVIDLAGTKSSVCRECFKIAEENLFVRLFFCN